MSKKQKKPEDLKNLNESEIVVEDQEINKPADAPKEISLIEKVKLMSDLAGATQSKEVNTLLKSLPNGERIFNIFLKAVEKELGSIMNGGVEEVPKEVNNLLSVVRSLNNSAESINRMLVGFHSSPLVNVLDMMNKNLGGKPHDFTAQNAPQQQFRAAPQQQIQNKPPAVNGSLEKQMEDNLASKMGF